MTRYLPIADARLSDQDLIKSSVVEDDSPVVRASFTSQVSRAFRIGGRLTSRQRREVLDLIRRGRFLRLWMRARVVVLQSLVWDQAQVSSSELPPVSSERTRDPVPTLTVVVVSFNYGHYLRECVESILRSSRSDYPIMIVDPGSSDSTPEICGDLIREHEARIMAFRREGRHLVGCNRNLALREASSTYVAFVDADDQVLPEYFELAIFLAETFALDAVGSQLELFGLQTGCWQGLPRRPVLQDFLVGNALPSHSVSRVESLLAAGGFVDEGLGGRLLFEDWRLWQRLAALGGRMFNMGQSLIRHRVHEQSQSREPSVHESHWHADLLADLNADVMEGAEGRQVRRAWSAPAVNWRSQGDSTGAGNLLVILVTSLQAGGTLRAAIHVARAAAERGIRTYICSTELSPQDLTSARAWCGDSQVYLVDLARNMPRDTFVPWLDYLSWTYGAGALLDISCPWFYGDAARQVRPLYRRIVSVQVNETYAAEAKAAMDCIDHFVVEQSGLLPLFKEAQCTSVIRNGLNLNAFPMPPERRTELQQVLWLGRLSDEKDPLLYVDIARALRGQGLEFHLVGAGPLQSAVTRRAKGLVTLHGEVPEARPYLQQADVLLLTSRIEGVPNALLEAMASGVVIVGPAVGGVPEVISDGINGLLLQDRSVVSYVGALQRLREDPGLVGRLREGGRSTVEERYSIDSMTSRYMNLLFPDPA